MNEADRIICRCEEVQLSTVYKTVREFHCSSREVKLRTRAGMGYCGGRTCRSVIDAIVESINEEMITDEIQLSYRPPVRPVTFGALGGVSYDTKSN